MQSWVSKKWRPGVGFSAATDQGFGCAWSLQSWELVRLILLLWVRMISEDMMGCEPGTHQRLGASQTAGGPLAVWGEGRQR